MVRSRDVLSGVYAGVILFLVWLKQKMLALFIVCRVGQRRGFFYFSSKSGCTLLGETDRVESIPESGGVLRLMPPVVFELDALAAPAFSPAGCEPIVSPQKLFVFHSQPGPPAIGANFYRFFFGGGFP